MAVQHKGTAIAIWVICAVLLVVVICLAVYLVCYRRRRREIRKLHRQLRHTEEEHSTVNDSEWNANGAAANPVALRGHASGSEPSALYPGFRRHTTEGLEALPAPTDSVSFAAPLVVYLRVRRDQAYMESCDILLTVDRLRDSVPTDHSTYTLLGNDSYYHECFLLYTAPLVFREPGLYVIQAFMVYPTKKIVGAVHQFTYVVTRDGIAAGGPGTYGHSSTANRHDNSIDIDIARRLADRNAADHPHTSALGDGNEPEVLSLPGTVGAASVPPSALQLAGPPLPPVILPSGGEVTTSTDIIITPNELSTTPDQLRYSVDGSYPNLLYSAPFTLSLPPPSLLPSQRRNVVIKAVAIRGSNGSATADSAMLASATVASANVSSITRVVLQVRPAGFSYFDTQVPTPSARLRARGATLYFDESKNPPGTQTVYELVYVNEARHKVRYSRQRALVYTGQPIALPENVATVHAWTITSAPTSTNAEVEERVRSVPTIYDCTRAATERGKLSRRRIEQYHLQPEQLLPPPVMCVSCGDAELMFDDPPANGRIAYTLNDTEPALYDVYPPACAVDLNESHNRNSQPRRRDMAEASPIEGDVGGSHTFLYQAGKRLRVTEMETKQVYVTARVFVPIFEDSDGTLSGSTGGQGGSCTGSGKLLGYRFGGVFHRGFYFN
ncbi:hypothetical protein ABB37_02095 [Leptomonas pyrrhocoris]|uniref:Uncharacterized protein n=1 Tax=Leptomonas pyrrhocoris TaxID=157538 RepID=A0A0M9G7H0_LEPPY|nr:hypothetical protein ABB37_02095 [Leptomonas pyrrhocoris]XP_015662378.1 hypothetical protein ABB37_02095 [Leptomonas pyrrhocoris]KPA83938.1 hypothetical protein ABB37_02095 [Leptomonas pyrrhocoris]KPA83939.1 hypothetical protein ABB37_02095 [Leptomonas pyrrhocoris]|eukprot:XP_015662377.1 hypothetical protein ABB37_02095 [Leptomonas pyrrhocoris]